MVFGLPLRERLSVAVLSPHLDDGVLSLGASIVEAVRAGHKVSVITVFAGDTRSENGAGDWDRRAGFATEGEAARRRMDEDRTACDVLGASPVWLPFADNQYRRQRDADEVWSRLTEAIQGEDAVLVPGRPLIHPDHLWLTRLVLERGLESSRMGAYAELPYDLWASADKRRHAPSSTPDLPRNWFAPRVTVRSRLAKWSAAGAYSSQLPWLGRGFSYRRALLQSRLGGERVAWQAS